MATIPLTVQVDPEADPLDLVQAAVNGVLVALDSVDGVTFAGSAGAAGGASRTMAGTIIAAGQTVQVTVTTERTA